MRARAKEAAPVAWRQAGGTWSELRRCWSWPRRVSSSSSSCCCSDDDDEGHLQGALIGHLPEWAAGRQVAADGHKINAL